MNSKIGKVPEVFLLVFSELLFCALIEDDYMFNFTIPLMSLMVNSQINKTLFQK